MAVDATAAAGSTSAVSSALGRTRLAENFDTFLTLLTTQLKNQDPLSPMDSNDFTQQMVQMTGVEQQLLTNDLLNKLIGNTSSGISTAVSLIGKEVRAVSDEAALSGGQAKWTYKLDSEAADVKLEILDSKGRIVKTLAGDKQAGEHALTWNGKDSNGVQLGNGGTYTLRVKATDTSFAEVKSTTFVQGTVTGVEQIDGASFIAINGGMVPWDRVTRVAQPSTAPGASS
ncbi:flagellar hook assembly protein FlgD [Phenylobacterium sp.]|jgi:flagellar basal-body rod modification protein FlgD|uniref:flagellar hook assembly protein FlgD n=1 Tax=Phenylobacterium sp. TaxID=1871053 RepID=UPI002F923AB1